MNKKDLYNREYRVNRKTVLDRTLKVGESRIITPQEAEAWYQETL